MPARLKRRLAYHEAGFGGWTVLGTALMLVATIVLAIFVHPLFLLLLLLLLV